VLARLARSSWCAPPKKTRSSLVKKLLFIAIFFAGDTIKRVNVIATTEAAKRLGVSSNRVRALIDSGRLKAQKIGVSMLSIPAI
jgi:excisionase family DNA binding protein